MKVGIATLYDNRIWRLVDYRAIYTSVALACQRKNLETHHRVAVVNIYMPLVGSAALMCGARRLQSGAEYMRKEFLSLVDQV